MPEPQKALVARPYRNFLTPALHRKFTHAALFTLTVCYVEAVWMGEWRLFRMWFPPLRTLMIFVSSLAVYILRVGNLHVGSYSTTSSFEAFWRRLLQMNTMQTLIWYTFSAWWFSEVYIWSAPGEARLWWIDYGRPYERSRLNERPIYLRMMFVWLAFVQSIFHLCWDYDRVTLAGKGPKSFQQPLPWLKNIGPKILHNAISRTAFCGLTGSLLYLFFIRHLLWDFAFSLASYFYTLQRNQRPPVIGGLMDMIGRFLVEAFFLGLLWEFCNAIFTDHVADEPLKRGYPLTNDSADPNGSLLQGLRARKEIPREFAFWELEIIATRFDDRRKTLFTELDSRTPAVGTETMEKSTTGKVATWTQIKAVCLSEIQRIDKRIKTVLEPPTMLTPEEQQSAIQPLPKLGVNPPRKDDVLEAGPPRTDRLSKTVSQIDQFARSHGHSPGARDPVSPRAQKLLTYTTQSALTPTQQAQGLLGSTSHQAGDFLVRFLKSPAGPPFRSTFARRATAVICGAPYAHTGAILHAASALAALVHHAKREDQFGLVGKDVPEIVRAFTATILNIQRFLREFGVHWTDVEFVNGQRGRVEEVEKVRRALAESLEKVLLAYGEFLEEMGMARAEITMAKDCVGKGSRTNANGAA